MCRLNRAQLTWLFLLLFSLGSAGAAQAQEQLFAVDGAGGGGLSTLYELSPTTGAVIVGPIGGLGAIGFPHVASIGFDPTGVLYGISNSVPPFVAGVSTLITIDTTLGTGAFVAPITGMTFCPAGDNVSDMSFDSSGILFVWRPCSSELYTVDLTGTLGLATPIGIPAVGLAFSSGLAFDSSDAL